MKKNLWLLFGSFIVFYILVHLSGHLPGLLRGKWTLVDERSLAIQTLSAITDLGISFLFVLSTYVVMYKYYPNSKYVQLFLHAGLILTICFISCFLAGYAATIVLSPDPVRLNAFFRNNILIYVLNAIFAMVFYFIRYTQQKELEQKELELQNRTSELSFLKSQVNPHFLFNNLNNIYSLVYYKSDQSLPAIAGLSELLRYMLYYTSETISLEKEIHYIEKYIALEQLRFEKPCQLSFIYPGDTSQIHLPPLLLIPFIENAFKHGAIAFDHTWLEIGISTIADGQVMLRCQNEIGQKQKDQSGGIGIENVRKRLNLLYPGNHNLDISRQDHTFKVELTLGTYENR